MMECNKEEAIRVKGIAEKQMENKDFVGARKIALKAQQLYPDLENISQMIMVCDVHCSGENSVYGNEKDWYSILKMDPTADEVSIKKQYRKFALLLHPDKNKFAGAADAFKLIGEAQRVLLDREKRMLHDSNCMAVGRFKASDWAARQASWHSNAGNPPWVQNNFMNNVNSQHPQQGTQSGFYNNRPTFWTMCPFCNVRYQFYREVLNKYIRCQSCSKSFTCYEINSQCATAGTSRTQTAVPRQEVPNQAPSKVGPQSTFEKNTSKEGSQGNVGSKKARADSFPKKGFTSEVGEGSIPNGKFVNKKIQEEGRAGKPKSYGKKDVKRKESSESCNNRSNTDSEEHIVIEEDGESPSKKAKLSESSSKSSPSAATEPETYEYPDSDFSDFDKSKKEDCFAAGQIWAVYDNLDGMPRFYALIRKVLSPGFKLRITWLESDPNDEDEIKWFNEGLPVSCGKFRYVSSENTDHHPMFSHLVNWEKGNGRNTLKIYPRKGETWALFKNWDIKWYSDPHSKRKYEFEFVQVLSDYDDCAGVRVAYLSKVKGFACLFCPKMEGGADSVLIPTKEIFRFSHMIPSFQMTGEERKDVPKGSFELDPACVPTNLEGIAIPENVKLEAEKIHPTTKPEGNVYMSDEDEKPHLASNSTSSDNLTEDNDAEPPSTPRAYEIPSPEFYDFDADKSPDKFQIGQIWALYSDEDGLPKYYGLIKKIDLLPEFKLHIAWIVTCSPSKGVIRWLDKKMPVCCGKFKPLKGKLEKYTETVSFSHQLTAEATTKDLYSIFPRKGEVWALYKNWDIRMKCSDLENCEYDMVEVLEENDSWIAVLALELVGGYKSVYKAQMKGDSTVTMKIPRVELLKFSHQIPAFRLTEERGGSLRGFWELDPAALPFLLFCLS